MNRRASASIALIAAACLAPVGRAQQAPPAQRPDGSLLDPGLRKNAAWTTEKWTGDNAPYHAAKMSLEATLEKYSYARWVVESYRVEFLKHPRDPMRLFRWAYVAYRTAFPGQYSRPSNAQIVRDWFFVVPSPHTVEYSRLRFLIDAREFPGFLGPEKLVPLGRRLLALDGGDLIVREKLMWLLICGGTLGRIDEGIRMAEDLLTKPNPGNDCRYMAGFGYCFRYYQTKDKTDARKGIAYWRAYASRCQSDKQRKDVDGYCKQLTKDAGP